MANVLIISKIKPNLFVLKRKFIFIKNLYNSKLNGTKFTIPNIFIIIEKTK